MSKRAIAVLVPGADGSGGIDAIRQLSGSGLGCRVVAVDRNRRSRGFHFSDSSYVIEDFTNESNFEAFTAILVHENVKVILPISLSSTLAIAERREQLEEIGVVFVASDTKTIRLCDDKLAFYLHVQAEFGVPQLLSIDGPPHVFPCFVKPRHGSGGIGASLCRSLDDWRFCSRTLVEPLAQEYLPGEEFSVDVLSDLDGVPLIAVPRRRLVVREGITVVGQVVRDRRLEALCLQMAEFLNLKGVSCMQLRRRTSGEFVFIDVNPRHGGSSQISSHAGLDLAVLAVKLGLNMPILLPEVRETTVIRYYTSVASAHPSFTGT